MTVHKFSGWGLFAIGLALAIQCPDDVAAEASGPDFYRVVGVGTDHTLHMRVGPSAEFPIIAKIPRDADGVANLGCKGGLTFEQWTAATEDERRASRANRWCLLGYDRTVGWVSGRFVAEGQPPDQFDAGTPLSKLSGSDWRLVRLGAARAEVDATIAFATEGRVSGQAGCNRFTGGYAEGPQKIAIGPLATTRMACPEPIMALELVFLNALEASTTYVARHLVLVLLDDRSAVVAQFMRTDWD